MTDNKSGCQAWNPDYYTMSFVDQTMNWSGECKGGKIYGDGVLKFTMRFIRNPDDKLFSEEDIKDRTVSYFGVFENGICQHDCYVELFENNKKKGKYTGGMKNNLPHGKGIFLYTSGKKYVGGFINGYRNGKGEENNNFGRYIGDWKNDRKHGQGTMTYSDNDFYRDGRVSYTGSFVKGIENGTGEMIFKDGKKYIGIFKHGHPQKSGTIIYPNGDSYSGGILNGIKHGTGTFTQKDGSAFQGWWRAGKLLEKQ